MESSGWQIELIKDAHKIRIATASQQGVKLSITGQHKKELRKTLNTILTLVAKNATARKSNALGFASSHQFAFPEIQNTKGEDGTRHASCRFMDVEIVVSAQDKKDLKAKMYPVLIGIMEWSTGVKEETSTEATGSHFANPSQDATTNSTAEGETFGTTNDWTKASFGTDTRKSKFLSLMGAKKAQAKPSANHDAQANISPEEPADSLALNVETLDSCSEEKKSKKRKKSESENTRQDSTKEGSAPEPKLHKNMSSWFVPPKHGEYHTLKDYETSAKKKYFVVLPGQQMPLEKVSAIDAETSQKITEDLQKGFNAAMKIKTMGVAGLGFQHYTHEQFSQNNLAKGNKIVFD